ncbi:MAG: PhnD/SsuA/transferrin family substrate-binding protein, partial [Actinomycetota bacterium]|nr:PhnD/SsuA/transferrin family substrate-binding protein [Actinomycetota bacterium]
MTPIRMVTWLAPGLPLALFEAVREALEGELGVPVSLEARTKLSGPVIGSRDPFGEGLAELGFLCAPATVPASVRGQAGFELLGLAPLFDDDRYEGQPRCYCDLVVRGDAPAERLEDLRGGTFGYNDPASLSGWLGLSAELKRRGTSPEAFFGQLVQTGGHLGSLEALRSGEIQVASIDSNVHRAHPGAMDGLRVVDSVGPWPSQPVVVR